MMTEPWIKRVQIGNATLYLGDANKIVPALGPVDIICTDPPYEFSSEGAGEFRKSRSYMDEIQSQGLSDGFDHHIIMNGRCQQVFVFVHEDQRLKVEHHLKSQFDRMALCFWHKTNPTPVHNKHFLPDIEQYLVAWNKGFHPLGGYADKSRVFRSSRGVRQFDHPTEKPIDLMRKIAVNMNGELVLDMFMGTGTTLVAAIERGKRVIGIEKNEQYFNTACDRLASMQVAA